MTAHQRAIEKLNEALDYLEQGKPGPALLWANHAALLASRDRVLARRCHALVRKAQDQIGEFGTPVRVRVSGADWTRRYRGQGTLPLEVPA